MSLGCIDTTEWTQALADMSDPDFAATVDALRVAYPRDDSMPRYIDMGAALT